MKENELMIGDWAPENIYIFENPILDFSKLSQRQSKDDIEYVRKDAFIEKAAEWQKEQMIKDAVDAKVTYGKSLAIPSLGYALDKKGLDYGDKAKLIIIKEE